MSEQTSTAGPSPEEGVFSLEDIDQIIAQEDPDFLNEMQEVASVVVDKNQTIDTIDPEIEIEESIEEDSNSLKDRIRKNIIDFVKNFKFMVTGFYKKTIFILRSRIYNFVTSSKQFLRHELPERIKYWSGQAKTGIGKLVQSLRSGIKAFRDLSTREKIGLFSLIVMGFCSIFLISKTFTNSWLPKFEVPIPRSLKTSGEKVLSYNGKEDLQDLFNAFPDVEYYVLMTKVVINLKPDSFSSRNPMGLYEVYLGLDSQDTAIEIKDRELEVLDLIQRSLEQFTYTEVNSKVGKVRMKEAIRDRLNTILNQGTVTNVYFSKFVTKI